MASGIIAERYQVGKRPQWSSVLSLIEAEDYPLTSMLRKGAAPKGALQNWQMKKYDTAAFTGVRDMVDATQFNHNPRVDVQAIAQKNWYNVGSSDFAEETEIVGVGKGEFSEQVYDGLVVLKRQIEMTVGSDNDLSVDNGTTTAFGSRGLFCWFQNAAQTATDYKVPDGWRTPTAQVYTGALASLTEEGTTTAGFMYLLRQAYNQRKGKVNLTGIVGTELKALFAIWTRYMPSTGTRQINITQGDRAIVNIIDSLDTDCGHVTLNLSSYLLCDKATGLQTAYSPKSGVFYPSEQVDMGYIRQPRVKNLEYQGGGYKAIIDAIHIVRAYNVLTGVVVKTNS